MTQFIAQCIHKHRHPLIVLLLKRRVGIDIQYFDLECNQPWLAAQGFQCGEHVFAQMAPGATEQPQRWRLGQRNQGLIYSPAP